MNLEDFLSPADIRQADVNLPVKAAGTQERIIQNIRAVGGRHNNDAFVIPETVHLHEELV